MSQSNLTGPSDIVASSFTPLPISMPFGASPARLFTVDEYHRMADTGVLLPGERVELIRGVVRMMSPIGAPHSTSVDLLYRLFLKLLPTGWDVTSQRDIVFIDSVPQPDVCVVRGAIRDYAQKKPRPGDLGIVIEVAETTLAEDRGEKLTLYAEATIPEYWIVNLVEKKLEVHRRPIAAAGDQPARYESIETLGPDQSVNVILDGVQVGVIAVRDVLP